MDSKSAWLTIQDVVETDIEKAEQSDDPIYAEELRHCLNEVRRIVGIGLHISKKYNSIVSK